MDAITRAEELGFTYVRLISVEDLEFSPEFRVCCEDNLCGNYGASHSCPPLCGTVEEMMAKVRKYSHGLVLCTESVGVDAYDWEQADLLKADHIHRDHMLIRELLAEKVLPGGGLRIFAGACSLCETCKAKEGKPCVMPDKMGCCLSAYCINVNALCEKADIPISWMGDVVSFFSMYLYND